MARVIIASFHRPVAKMIARHTALMISGRTPAEHERDAEDDQPISHHGESASRSWNGLISPLVTPSFSASVTTSTLSIPSRTGR